MPSLLVMLSSSTMAAQDPGDALAAGTLVTEVDSTSVGNPAPLTLAKGEREDVGTSKG